LTFDVSTQKPPIPPPGPWLNDFIQDVEKENLINRMVLSQFSTGQALRVLFVGLTIALAGYALIRLISRQPSAEPAPPPSAVDGHHPAPAPSAIERRHRDLLRSGNLREAARQLALVCLEAVRRPGDPCGQPRPAVRGEGGWWENILLRRRFNRVWQLAYDPKPARVSPQRFVRLVRDIDHVKAALVGRRLRIDSVEIRSRPVLDPKPA
jgi:hypothetical protein